MSDTVAIPAGTDPTTSVQSVPPCDLLAEVATPDGVTAGRWGTDAKGRLVRTLSDGSIQRGNGDIVTQCRQCTVPTPDAQGVCAFCASYSPPETIAQRLDIAVNKVDLLRHDLNEALRELAADAPSLAVVDLVTALGHLKRAAVALDRATDTLEADGQAVRR